MYMYPHCLERGGGGGGGGALVQTVSSSHVTCNFCSGPSCSFFLRKPGFRDSKFQLCDTVQPMIYMYLTPGNNHYLDK